MPTLLLAEHDNAILNLATAKALSAAKALGGEVHILVAGEGCRGWPRPPPSSPGSTRCCWRRPAISGTAWPRKWPS